MASKAKAEQKEYGRLHELLKLDMDRIQPQVFAALTALGGPYSSHVVSAVHLSGDIKNASCSVIFNLYFPINEEDDSDCTLTFELIQSIITKVNSVLAAMPTLQDKYLPVEPSHIQFRESRHSVEGNRWSPEVPVVWVHFMATRKSKEA